MPGMFNPQNLNRYMYVLGNPLKYTDPSGHEVCDEDGNCHDADKGWYLAPGAKKWNYSKLIGSGYSNWESQALSKLYGEGGREGRNAVNNIVKNDIHIVFNPETQPAAWHLFSNDIYLDSDQYSEQSDPTNPYMLSLIAHEAVHLEQGPLKAITLAGEVEAWQTQFRVYKTMVGRYPGNQDAVENIMTLDAGNLDSNDLQNTRVWMKDFDPGYRSEWLLPWSLEFIRKQK